MPEKGTAEVQIYPVKDTRYFLIDTPGFDDTVKTDAQVLQSIAACLADMHEGLTFEGLEVTLSGIIYVHSVCDERMTGSMMKNLTMFPLLVGQSNMEHCVLVTSKWGIVGPREGGSRESELVGNYWGELLAGGAHIARFEDGTSSALDIVKLSCSAGLFTPQLTQEFAIQGMPLHRTAAGRAIDKDIAKAYERQEKDLEKWRKEYQEALEAGDARWAAELEAFSSKANSQLQILHEETERLRTNRDLAQTQMDEADSNFYDYKSYMDQEEIRHRARQKRALRWFARFGGMGAAVTLTVLTGGAMAPVGISLYAAIETVCQADKNREAKIRDSD